ncbi:MAG: IgGFc-binding protein [Ignavibacteriae bacterium]|nr:IgGFc-binding protein [Ignavibacteriota bacterium]
MTKPILVFLAIVLSIVFLNQELIAATNSPEKTNEGKEFWLCFQRNYKDSPMGTVKSKNDLILQLFLAGNKESNVVIEIDGINFRREVKVSADSVTNVIIDAAAQVKSDEIPERLAVHIVSNNPITVYGLNSRWQTTDTYLGLPVMALGKEYYAIGYKYSEGLLSQFAIIATEDETNVTITTTVTTSKKHPSGEPFSVKLRKGDVYQVTSLSDSKGNDLTGSHIEADKKIAVFSGHQCAYVPEGVVGCNHLVEQLQPVSTWGNNFFVGMLGGRSKYTIRIVASRNTTNIYENSKLVSTINAGEFYENSNVTENVQITTDHPVMVAQYSQGFLNGDSVGDPMMLLINPKEQFLRVSRFATPKTGQWRHFVNIAIRTSGISSIQLDGKPVDHTQFNKVGDGEYSIGQIQVLYGSHLIEADEFFGISSYGFGYGDDAYDAYGNMGGQSFFEIK